MEEKVKVNPLSNPIDDPDRIIIEIDPDAFKCHDCENWFHIKHMSTLHKGHCINCHPDPLNPYQAFALPLMKSYYPKLITKDLISVVPMDKPNVVRGFLNKAYSK